MDAETLALLRTSLAQVLTAAGDGDLAGRLDALGWDEVLADDEAAAIRVLFETKGVTLSAHDALGPVIARSIAGSVGDADLVAATVVLPRSLHPHRLSATVDGGAAIVHGVVLAPTSDDRAAIVPVAAGQGVRLAVVAPGVPWTRAPLAGTDGSLGLSEVAGVIPASSITWIEAEAAVPAWLAATVRVDGPWRPS